MVAATSAVGRRETPIDVMHRNLRAAAQRLGLEPDLFAVLSRPAREIRVELPIRMDDGTQQLVPAFRVQHNDARGPYLGGFRVYSGVNIEQLRALAFAMTWKCALANVPFGGAQGGVVCDLNDLSVSECERLTRKYVSRMLALIGPYSDIVAPDVNAGEKQIAWMLDEYSQPNGGTAAAFVGKPMQLGGLIGHDRAVGRGLCRVLAAVANTLALNLRGLSVAIHGFGKVGASAAIQLANAGCRITAVSDSGGAIYNRSGIDPCELLGHKQRTGSVAGFVPAQTITQDALLESGCDVLIPAALDCVLTARNAARVRARIILEVANIPTTSAADTIFARKGTIVVPDILANSASAIAAHLEWDQNLQQIIFDEDHVNSEIDKNVLRAYGAVAECAREEGVTLREAAYLIAVERVARTERLRAA